MLARNYFRKQGSLARGHVLRISTLADGLLPYGKTMVFRSSVGSSSSHNAPELEVAY